MTAFAFSAPCGSTVSATNIGEMGDFSFARGGPETGNLKVCQTVAAPVGTKLSITCSTIDLKGTGKYLIVIRPPNNTLKWIITELLTITEKFRYPKRILTEQISRTRRCKEPRIPVRVMLSISRHLSRHPTRFHASGQWWRRS